MTIQCSKGIVRGIKGERGCRFVSIFASTTNMDHWIIGQDWAVRGGGHSVWDGSDVWCGAPPSGS